MTKYTFKCILQCMDYITTTNLRTHSSRLIDRLKKGNTVSLIHRSIIVGVIQPSQDHPFKQFDNEKFDRLVRDLNLPKTTVAQRQQRYKSHLLKKYGQGVS